jgi:hypothetical protein
VAILGIAGFAQLSSLALAAEAVRYRLAFPGVTLGQELPQADVIFWVAWLKDRNYDVGGFARRQGFIDVILREGDSREQLLQAGFTVIETEDALPLPDRETIFGVPSGYVNPAALEAFMIGEAAAHPTITDLTVIGQSIEGRNIYAMEISNNPGVPEDEPSFSLNGLHHSREVVTPHVVMDAITYLTDQYEAGNPQVVDWVDNYKIFCVPMVNPDGSNRVFTVNDFHRKNMQPVCTGSNPGVDLNRNYPYHWGSGPENCERGTGSSGNTCADTYRGGGPASEPETLAMMSLAAQQRFVIAVSYHSYGEFIDYPYACNDGNPDMSMPEHQIIDELMHGAAAGIVSAGGPVYDVYSPIAIGPVNGDDTSWYYAHNGTYALIIEVGLSFQPPFNTGMTYVAQNRGGWLYLLNRMGRARIDVRVEDHITDRPLDARVELLDFTFDTGEWPRYADPMFGRSRWLVPANDTYTVRVSAPGYQTRVLGVAVANEPVDLPVLLLPAGVVLGDHEPDGDVDMDDYVMFHACVGATPIPQECRVLDFTADEMVTLADYAAFEAVLAGP